MAKKSEEQVDTAQKLLETEVKIKEAVQSTLETYDKRVRQAANFERILTKTVAQHKQATGNAKNTNDLLDKMVNKSKVYKKTKEKILELTDKEIERQKTKVLRNLSMHLDLEEDIAKRRKLKANAGKEINELAEELTGEMKDQLSILEQQLKANTTLRGALGKLSDSIRDSALGNLLFRPKALLVGGMLGVGKIIIDSFMEVYNFLDKKVIPATAELNKTLGNSGSSMTQLKKQAVSTGVRFEKLGMTFQDGAEAVRGIAEGMMTVRVPNETLQTTLKMSEYVGMGAENAGRLALTFQKTTGSTASLDKAMKGLSEVTAEYGVPVNQVRRDMGEFPDILARFGSANINQFGKSATIARTYGLTIGQLNNSFGEQLDTFEGSANAASKLNAVFGTSINTFDLLFETNPEKRFEMIREELVAQGKTWDDLNPFQKNALKNTLDMSAAEAQLAFASEDVRKRLKAKQKQIAKNNKVNEDWDSGLTNIKSTLLAWGPLLQQLQRSVGNFVARLLGFDNASEPIIALTNFLERNIPKVSKWLDSLDVTPFIDIVEVTNEYINTIKSVTGKDITKFFDGFGKKAKTVIEMASAFVSITDSVKTLFDLTKPAGGTESKYKLEDYEEFLDKERARMQRQGKGTKELEKSLKTWLTTTRKSDWLDVGVREDIFGRLAEDAGSLVTDDQKRRRGIGRGFHAAQDALITSKGDIIKFHPQDNIVATKANINPKDVATAAAQGTSSAGGSVSDIRVEVVDINMDGRKVGEAQVRISKR